MNAPRAGLALAIVPLGLLWAGCDGPTEPTPIVTPNSPPTITSLTVGGAPRVEVGEAATLRAEVTDSETAVAQLTFLWTATASGTFTGTGPQVTWRPAMDLVTPVAAVINLTVVERYSVPVVGGGTDVRENRTSQAVTLHVNNSMRETSDLALSFLRDFANSTVTPVECVRNFTDNCKGKADERADIEYNRANYQILESSFYVSKVEIDAAGMRAVIWAPCQFKDKKLTAPDAGTIGLSSGICLMTAVYEPYRWWLCNSNWCDEVTKACIPSFRSRSRIIFQGGT